MDATYRQTDDGWETLRPNGEHLPPEPSLEAARDAAGPVDGTEWVRVPFEGHGVTWGGLRFAVLPPEYDADAPTVAQAEQLAACAAYYRERVPAGMRVECAGNRVRVDPAASGLAGELFAGLSGSPADSTAQARAQLRLALELPVPEGFVRVAHDFVGLEEFGDVGHFHLVLRERWPLDAPCL